MKTFTICLYSGDVGHIDRVIESYTVEGPDSQNVREVDYMHTCFDYQGPVDAEKYPDFHKWSYHSTSDIFACYYCRSILYAENLICVDYGSYTNFIVVVEGNHKDDIKQYFNEFIREKSSQETK